MRPVAWMLRLGVMVKADYARSRQSVLPRYVGQRHPRQTVLNQSRMIDIERSSTDPATLKLLLDACQREPALR